MNKMMSGVIALAGALLLVPAGAEAQSVEMSGNVSIVSDYSFRGISQTLEEPAIQGGIDLALPALLYAGVWGSSVSFGEDIPGPDRAQMELDLYGGFAPVIAGFDADVGAIYYLYPGAHSSRGYDFWEIYGGLSRGVGPLGVGVSVAYSPDFFGDSGESIWAGIDASAAIPNTPFSIDGSYGHQSIEENVVFGTPDYNAWSAGLSTELLGTSFGASITGTDIGAGECFGASDLCDTRVILSVGRTL